MSTSEDAPAAPQPPLGGLHNFRDLGGHPTSDGYRVRCGQVFRSATLDFTGADDRLKLIELGIRCIFDFRPGTERGSDVPPGWMTAAGIDYWSPPAVSSVGDPKGMVARCLEDAAQTRRVIFETYEQIAFDQAAAYTELFARLARGDTPLLLHCASGKDRTGVASALLLTALGVPRPMVIAEYALTNAAAASLRELFLADPKHAVAAQTPFERWAPIMKAEPEYIETMFAAVTRRFGSVDAYLDAMLGVTPTVRDRLKAHLLEPMT